MTEDNKGMCYDAVSISCYIVTSLWTCDPCLEAGQQTPNDEVHYLRTMKISLAPLQKHENLPSEFAD
jgi:hypothetical protein